MSEVELEPDRNRLHDLVRLVWSSAQSPDAPDGESGNPTSVTDEDVANAGPYSLQQVRDHLTAEHEGAYALRRDGDTVHVVTVQDA